MLRWVLGDTIVSVSMKFLLMMIGLKLNRIILFEADDVVEFIGKGGS